VPFDIVFCVHQRPHYVSFEAFLIFNLKKYHFLGRMAEAKFCRILSLMRFYYDV